MSHSVPIEPISSIVAIPSKMTIGIDQSFTSTGIVMLDVSGAVQASCRISSNPDQDIFDRAQFITAMIIDFVRDYPAADIAMEGLAFGGVGNATRDLAGLQFHIVIELRKRNRNVIIYTPQTVKKTAELPKGSKRGKAEMIAALPSEVAEYFATSGYKKTKGLPDVTDAYWIARTHINKLKSQPIDGTSSTKEE